MLRQCLAVCLSLGFIPAAAGLDIVRYTYPGSVPLQAVYIPPGAATLYITGQRPSPLDPAKAEAKGLTMADFGDTKAQTINVLAKIKGILEADGFTMGDLVKLTIYLAGDPKLGGKMDYAGMDEGFKVYFGTTANPITVTRSTVQVAALTSPNYLVQIEATAAKAPSAKAPEPGNL